MIKKLLAKLANWEEIRKRKSDWTKVMEVRGLDNATRKQIMEEAKNKWQFATPLEKD